MEFKYNEWDKFCSNLKRMKLVSIPANEVKNQGFKYIVLKHDVETNVFKALILASIEHKYGHRGSYYVQAYLLNDKKTQNKLKSDKD